MIRTDIQFALRGAEVALVNIAQGLERDDLGAVESWEVYRIEDRGWGLSVVFSSKRHGGGLVRKRAGLVGSTLSPEIEGEFFASGLIEALLMTRSDDAQPASSEPVELKWPGRPPG